MVRTASFLFALTLAAPAAAQVSTSQTDCTALGQTLSCTTRTQQPDTRNHLQEGANLVSGLARTGAEQSRRIDEDFARIRERREDEARMAADEAQRQATLQQMQNDAASRAKFAAISKVLFEQLVHGDCKGAMLTALSTGDQKIVEAVTAGCQPAK